MNIKLNNTNRKRVFSLPCCIFDNYIKTADDAALKVILCLYSSDEPYLSECDIASLTGLDISKVEGAISFWVNNGEISSTDVTEDKKTSSAEIKAVRNMHPKIDLTEYSAAHPKFKEYISEVEAAIGKMLSHYEKETLAILIEYYNFSPAAAVLIFEHSAKFEHYSSKYVESVAAELHDKGVFTYEQLEQEFMRMDEYKSFENELKRSLGIYGTATTKKQKELFGKWKGLGFGVEMISLAGERCIDATTKLSLPYVDKVLSTWAAKGIFTPEAAEAENSKSTENSIERTFDLDEYDDFTLGKYIKK